MNSVRSLCLQCLACWPAAVFYLHLCYELSSFTLLAMSCVLVSCRLRSASVLWTLFVPLAKQRRRTYVVFNSSPKHVSLQLQAYLYIVTWVMNFVRSLCWQCGSCWLSLIVVGCHCCPCPFQAFAYMVQPRYEHRSFPFACYVVVGVCCNQLNCGAINNSMRDLHSTWVWLWFCCRITTSNPWPMQVIVSTCLMCGVPVCIPLVWRR